MKIDEDALARVTIPTGPTPGPGGMPPLGSPTGH